MHFEPQTNPGFSAPPAARFDGAHGYRIEGDTAYLNADIAWSADAAAQPAWTLQLYAHPADRARNGSAIKVAELPLRVAAAYEPHPVRVEAEAFALPPAGTARYTMVLQLSAGGDTVHDEVEFRGAEQFVQPRLHGGSWQIEGDTVHLRAALIDNPRDAANLSGSLVLELWSLHEPYRGGAFRGVRLAGAELGRLGGGESWADVHWLVDAEASAPSAEVLCLMLREWTAAGYLTRDYVAADAAAHQPALQASLPQTQSFDVRSFEPQSFKQFLETQSSETQSSETQSSETQSSHPQSSQPATSEPARPSSTPRPAETAQPEAVASVEAPTAVDAMPAARAARATKAPARVEPASTAASSGSATVSAPSGRVSVNRATVAQLAAVKGLPKAVAAAIVAARPHASLDALVSVKGMGPKLLQKLRDALSI